MITVVIFLSVVILVAKCQSTPTGNEKLPLILLSCLYFFLTVYTLYCAFKFQVVIKKRNLQSNGRFQWHLRRMALLNYFFAMSNFGCSFLISLATLYDRKALSLHAPTQLIEVLTMSFGVIIYASLLWYFNPNSVLNEKVFQGSNEQQQRIDQPKRIQIQDEPEAIELEEQV
eukprot:TRINITY_DN10466_c0_g1_i1.p1 TRINITY_DN10466_c0_g1~~TRINITY_DN10466_c0_g1_i1.p1  ORF type:complete len:172 (-),score=21.91 TRINITY_DN10466_c0_g1_i1:3-518(-)